MAMERALVLLLLAAALLATASTTDSSSSESSSSYSSTSESSSSESSSSESSSSESSSSESSSSDSSSSDYSSSDSSSSNSSSSDTNSTAVDNEQSDYGPCYRDCSEDPTPRTCIYDWTEEYYPTCGTACGNCTNGTVGDCAARECVCPDGVEKSMVLINRKFPSPSIHVCKDDEVVVKLSINTIGHGETIHWHGIRQLKTPYMDGVGMVTQCPINEGQEFEYHFQCETAGSYFFHSHYGFGKTNGAVGSLIVREADDPHKKLYTKDLAAHTIVMNDYWHWTAELIWPGLSTGLTGTPSQNILFDGVGPYYDSTYDNYTATPRREYVVCPGERYRFRFVGGSALHCPLSIQIENHTMLLIATDGMNVEPVEINTLVINSGERFDVVINATEGESGDLFWIHSTNDYSVCVEDGASDQLAVLRYASEDSDKKWLTLEYPDTTAPNLTNRLPSDTVLNDPLYTCNSSDTSEICVAELEALEAPSDIPYTPRKLKNSHFVAVEFTSYTDEELYDNDFYYPYEAIGTVNVIATLNNISFETPRSSFFQPNHIGKSACSPGNLPDKEGCNDTFCVCSHVMKLKSWELWDVILMDVTTLDEGDNGTTSLSHPFHMHGYSFVLMGMGARLDILDGQERVEYFKLAYENGTLPMHSEKPGQKDTITLLAGGYAWMRIFADNPGAWFLHCHYDYHLADAMAMVMQVGEVTDNSWKWPPHGFPQCGDYVPSEGLYV